MRLVEICVMCIWLRMYCLSIRVLVRIYQYGIMNNTRIMYTYLFMCDRKIFV